MASPRERDHRGEISRSTNFARQLALSAATRSAHRHHFHDAPPWPHQHHHDYVHVDSRWGWWPRWYPYSDPGWYRYWWQLYDYYGGDASPAYAEYARDAILRQRAPELGLVVSGYGGTQVGRYTQPAQPVHYQHPHYNHGDYVTVNGSWWPRWFPYWDPSWCRYWWQLYQYYGGDAHREYAEHARDAHLRSQMTQLGAR
jgi:hypothetical protein